ncbi:MAG: cysteine synthase family protein [bacterium]
MQNSKLVVAENIFELIGNTPLLRIPLEQSEIKLYAKLEGQNIGGSVKDRAAYSMIVEAEKRGELTKEMEIIEATSGNTGIALAMIAAVKGYKITIVMSEAMSVERRKMIQLYGANLILTPAALGTGGAITKVHEMMAAQPGKYWHANQHDNPDNALIHYNTTAMEILEQLPDVTHIFAGIGTFGTVRGISKRFREEKRAIKIIGIEPFAGIPIQGLRNMSEINPPQLFDKNFLDEIINVDAQFAKPRLEELARKSGLFVGFSSAAIYHGALTYLKNVDSATAVMIFPDKGEKYLSMI